MSQEITATDPTSLWREPTQSRGRQRAKTILDATRKLVAEHGVANVKMTEVARVAKVPIGSVYQYFPTRNALLSKLFEDQVAPIDAAFEKGLSQLQNWGDLDSFIDATAEVTYRMVQQDPCLQKIWSSTGIDPVIQAADHRNTMRNAALLVDALKRITPNPIPEQDAFSSAVLICHFWGSMIQLLHNLEEGQMRQDLLNQFSQMVRNHLDGLSGGHHPVT